MFDTIKSIIGDIASGAVKDQRIALSQEQLSALDAKLRDALQDVSRLQKRVGELERAVADRDSHIAQLQPHDSLDSAVADTLRFFFEQARDLSRDHIAARFHIPVGVAAFHIDVLAERGFVQLTVIGIFDGFWRPASDVCDHS